MRYIPRRQIGIRGGVRNLSSTKRFIETRFAANISSAQVSPTQVFSTLTRFVETCYFNRTLERRREV